jgi:hypothetical protein
MGPWAVLAMNRSRWKAASAMAVASSRPAMRKNVRMPAPDRRSSSAGSAGRATGSRTGGREGMAVALEFIIALQTPF